MTATESSRQVSRTEEQDALEEFSARFVKQSGMIYLANNFEEVISTVNDLIQQRGKGDSCCALIKLLQNGLSVDMTKEIHSTIPFDDFQRNPRAIANRIDVGITKGEYAVAETGSIVDISLSDEHRLLSSFSRVHIAVVERSRFLKKLQELAPRIRDLIGEKNSGMPKPSMTLIGGPSRTSDIELKSVLGVHGPHEVHVVVSG